MKRISTSLRRMQKMTSSPAVVVAIALLICMPFFRVAAGPSGTSSVTVQPSTSAGPSSTLKVANGQLQRSSDSAPFLLISDAGYDIMRAVPPAGNGGANMANYFSTLQSVGFNASIEQAFVFSDRTGKAYDGTMPFTTSLPGCAPADQQPCWDISTPNPAYWKQVVAMVNLAGQYGVIIELLTIAGGGCASDSPMQMLINNGQPKAYNFGVFLGNTFKTLPNIIWYHGDDYSCFNISSTDNLMYAMAQGIQSTGDIHIQTMELCGPYVKRSLFLFPTSPAGYCAPSGAGLSFPTSLDDTTNNWASILKINWVYQYGTTFQQALHAYTQSPSTPVFLGEINWAGSDGNTGSVPGCQTSAQIATAPYCPIRQRQEVWWPATFGAYWGASVGRNTSGPYHDFAYPSPIPVVPDTQFIYLANFMKSIPWYKLQPSPGGSNSIVTAGYGSNAAGTTLSSTYVTSSLAADGSLAVIYFPNANQGPITVNMAKMASGVTAKWYDPTADPTQSGSYTTICSSSGTACSTGSQSFTNPLTHSDGSRDAVLLLRATTGD
jgi:Protein of unknown function (DUF4038)/Putative collagen-binding domain of a collagenase